MEKTTRVRCYAAILQSVPPCTMVRGRRTDGDAVKRGRSATTRLADPTTENDAVRDAQDVGVTWTVE